MTGVSTVQPPEHSVSHRQHGHPGQIVGRTNRAGNMLSQCEFLQVLYDSSFVVNEPRV